MTVFGVMVILYPDHLPHSDSGTGSNNGDEENIHSENPERASEVSWRFTCVHQRRLIFAAERTAWKPS